MSKEVKNTSITLTPELRELLEQWSEEDDLNMSQLVRLLLKREAQRRQQNKEQKIKH